MAQHKVLDSNGLLYLWQKLKVEFAKYAVAGDIPTKVSDLTNDSGFQTAAQVDTAITGKGYQTAQDVETAITGKGYQTEAQVNTAITSKGYQTSAQVESAITGKGYQTETQVSNLITAALADIQGITFEIVQTLPATGEAGTIYLISHSGSAPDVYDEYIYVNNGWEKLGTTDIDLSGYVQDSDLVAITNAEIDTIVAS